MKQSHLNLLIGEKGELDQSMGVHLRDSLYPCPDFFCILQLVEDSLFSASPYPSKHA
ncbi:hypothetical protein AAC387_Pa11g0532 [Persea americana]